MSYFREYLASKIHNATVTEANIAYEGSISIDEELMRAADIHEYQKVLVASTTTGQRLETYVIKANRFSGVIGMNGAAAHLIKSGEKVIIMAFETLAKSEVIGAEDSPFVMPRIVFVNDKNMLTGTKI